MHPTNKKHPPGDSVAMTKLYPQTLEVTNLSFETVTFSPYQKDPKKPTNHHKTHIFRDLPYSLTLTILTPTIETPDPPNDTPGASKQVATWHPMTSQGFLG